MLYREVKKNGDRLSILGFGCMRLPQRIGTPGVGKIDEPRAAAQLRMAIDQGVNYIDTAYLYHGGGSELFLGKFLSDGYRDKVYLATKLPPWLADNIDDMNKILNVQLERLKTSHIDYYLVHGIDEKSWDRMEALGVTDFLDQAKKDGRIVSTGFSFHGEREAFPKIVDAYDWDMCQIQYNYLDENYQAGKEGLQYAASKDLGVVIMEPLRGGILAKKPPQEIGTIWKETNKNRSPAEWAFRWLWNHPEVNVVLSGMNEEEQIKENLQITADGYPGNLIESDLEAVEKVKNKYRSLMKAACTGCYYCMPCPYGVDIPTCFEAYNHKYLYGNAGWAKILYLSRLSGAAEDSSPARASQCRDCGKCVEKCPQKLPIPELMPIIAAELEGRFFNTKAWLFGKYKNFLKWNIKRKS